MKEIKSLWKVWGVLLFLWIVRVLFSAYVDDNHYVDNPSSVLLLCYAVLLHLHYRSRVAQRGIVYRMLLAMSFMIGLFLFLQFLKYVPFHAEFAFARHLWYLYYIPLVFIPLFFLYTAIGVGLPESAHLPGWCRWLTGFAILLVILVLTNDLHQIVFIFKPGFKNWDSDYSWGIGYYIYEVWRNLLILITLFILQRRCRIASMKHISWTLVLTIVAGYAYIIYFILLDSVRINGSNLGNFPDAYCFTLIFFWEGAFCLGLIPSNHHYEQLLHKISLAVQITDQDFQPVYQSASAAPLTKEQMADSGPVYLNEDTVLHRTPLQGGYGFWQQDLTELNVINRKLEETQQQLLQEANILRLDNEVKEQQKSAEMRSRLYDEIAQKLHPQILRITELTQEVYQDTSLYNHHMAIVSLLAVYIKRTANLMLLAAEKEKLSLSELTLSITEFFHYLNNMGIPSDIIEQGDTELDTKTLLALNMAIGSLIEENLSRLQGLFVRVQGSEDWSIKLTLEGVALTSLTPSEIFSTCFSVEEDTTYVQFAKGGKLS